VRRNPSNFLFSLFSSGLYSCGRWRRRKSSEEDVLREGVKRGDPWDKMGKLLDRSASAVCQHWKLMPENRISRSTLAASKYANRLIRSRYERLLTETTTLASLLRMCVELAFRYCFFSIKHPCCGMLRICISTYDISAVHLPVYIQTVRYPFTQHD
jgi:hypothetical protein